MEAKHTPGPWTVGRELNSERPGSVPVVALVRDSLEGKMHVAFVNGKAGEQDANARLIAAAPDLLAALRSLADKARSINGLQHAGATISPSRWSDLYDATATAHAVISRATGGGA